MAFDIASDIKKIAERKGLSLLWIAEQIGMSKPGFYGMLNSNSIKVEVLEKIASVLGVPIIYFFTLSDTEKKKLLEGNTSNAWDNLSNMVAAVGFAVVWATTFNKIRQISDSIDTDNNYTKEIVSSDLKSLSDDMQKVMELLSKYNDTK